MRGRRALLWVAAVAVTVTGGLVAVGGYHSDDSPDGVVRAYFAALARSDAPAALAYGQAPPGVHTFLTSEVLREQQQLAPLTGVHVDAPAPHGSLDTVRYSYRLGFATGPQSVSGTVDVVRRGSDWRLASPVVLVQLHLATAQNLASLAGAAIPDDTIQLFPGAVPVRFATTSLQLSADTDAVGLGDQAVHELVAQVSPAGATALRAALAGALTTCFGGTSPAQASCPLPVGDRVVPGSLVGTLSGTPAKDAELAVEGVGDGRITVTGRLAFSGRYRELDFDNLPHDRRGTLTLALDATAAASTPATIVFGDGT